MSEPLKGPDFRRLVRAARIEEERKQSVTRLEHENHRMRLALIAADKMAKAIDVMIEVGGIGSRSIAADARLNYGEPFTYQWTDEHTH